MKLVVETTGPFQLVGHGREHFVRHNRPSVVPTSADIDVHIGAGRAKLLGKIDASVTDADLAKALAEGTSVEDFVAAHAPDAEAEAASKPQGRSRKS